MLLQRLGNLLARIFAKETMPFCSLLNGPLCRLSKLTSRCSETNSIAAALQKQKGNFQPDKVTSVVASMPNNVHTSRSVTLFDQYR